MDENINISETMVHIQTLMLKIFKKEFDKISKEPGDHMGLILTFLVGYTAKMLYLDSKYSDKSIESSIEFFSKNLLFIMNEIKDKEKSKIN